MKNNKPKQQPNNIASINSSYYFNNELVLLNDVTTDVPGVLKMVFEWYNLPDFKANLWQFLQAALSNTNNSAYAVSYRCTNLIKYYDAVLLLIPALHTINHANNNVGKSVINKPGEGKQPQSVIKAFCTSYTYQYTKIELWDWLDAAIANDTYYANGLSRSYTLLLYQMVSALVEAAFLIANS